MADRTPQVSVIILNWNGRAHLPDCLDSLVSQTLRDFEVVLVDNGSSDGSAAFVRECYPWVRLVPLAENLGFAEGNNRALSSARGEYIVTLNNDTRAEPDWLETLVRTADAYPKAGMIGSRICSFDDSDVIDSLGMGICRDGMSRGRYRNRRWSSLRLPEVEEILFPSACAALYKRAMLQDVGFFDGDFFAYAEDTDLGMRGRLAGWGAVLATGAIVLHKYSRSAGAFSPFKVRLVERNHYWVVLKTFPWRSVALLPFHTVVRYLVQLCGIVKGEGAGAEFAAGSRPAIVKALALGIFGALGGILRMLSRRRRIMTHRKISTGELERLLRRHRLSFRELLDMDERSP